MVARCRSQSARDDIRARDQGSRLRQKVIHFEGKAGVVAVENATLRGIIRIDPDLENRTGVEGLTDAKGVFAANLEAVAGSGIALLIQPVLIVDTENSGAGPGRRMARDFAGNTLPAECLVLMLLALDEIGCATKQIF